MVHLPRRSLGQGGLSTVNFPLPFPLAPVFQRTRRQSAFTTVNYHAWTGIQVDKCNYLCINPFSCRSRLPLEAVACRRQAGIMRLNKRYAIVLTALRRVFPFRDSGQPKRTPSLSRHSSASERRRKSLALLRPLNRKVQKVGHLHPNFRGRLRACDYPAVWVGSQSFNCEK